MPGGDSNPRALDRKSDTLPTAPRRHDATELLGVSSSLVRYFTASDDDDVLVGTVQLWLTDLEVLAVILSALMHDFEHTGTTNAYHINTRHAQQSPSFSLNIKVHIPLLIPGNSYYEEVADLLRTCLRLFTDAIGKLSQKLRIWIVLTCRDDLSSQRQVHDKSCQRDMRSAGTL